MTLGTDGVLALDEWELATNSRYKFSVVVWKVGFDVLLGDVQSQVFSCDSERLPIGFAPCWFL
jgi:hypothetical protein